MKKNVDLDFVDDDPKLIPQFIEWRWDAGDDLPKWDGRFDEVNNSDVMVVVFKFFYSDEERNLVGVKIRGKMIPECSGEGEEKGRDFPTRN